jgi:hypothetical protein
LHQQGNKKALQQRLKKSLNRAINGIKNDSL